MEPHVDVARLVDALDTSDADLLPDVETYLSEALFFIDVLRPDLASLSRGARITEIGSGVGLLSMLVASLGHHVTSYEPESAGFSSMARARRLLLETWTGPDIDVTWVDDTFACSPSDDADQDFVYAINVIEHVPDPASLIENATRALQRSGTARFICANYDFPYESHIGIPTVWSKPWTRRLFERRILESPIPDIERFWDDLSWPSVRSIRRDLRDADLELHFGRTATAAYIDRLEQDPTFSDRKGPVFTALTTAIRPALALGVRALPPAMLPIIDLTTTRSRA